MLSVETAHEVGIETMMDETRSVNIADIIEIRAGVDLDPETSTAALQKAAKEGVQVAIALLQKRESSGYIETHSKTEKRSSIVKSIFGGHQSKEDELLYATPILRKKAKPEEYSQCLSLITADRFVLL